VTIFQLNLSLIFPLQIITYLCLALIGQALFASDSPYLSRGWLKLLHFKHNNGTAAETYIIEEKFFLSPQKRTPKKEWEAALKLFSSPINSKNNNEDPRCLFPARFKFINMYAKNKLGLIECPNLQKWKDGVNARAVTIVHAAQYIGNPASFFGHLFLRFDVAAIEYQTLRLDTLAHSIGFFAQMPPGTNAFDYVVKGLGGGFPASFIFSTYAKSLEDYNYIEDRDLWEYELNLSQDKIDFMLDHLWEMKNFGKFDYYFLKENCAYQLLAFLEAVEPNWHLTDDFFAYTLPAEGLAKLFAANAIRESSYRPSLGTQLRKRVKKLKAKQLETVDGVIEGVIKPTDVESPEVLDVVIDLIEYKTHKKKGKVPKKYLYIKKESMEKRSSLPILASENIKASPPHLGHSPSRIQVGIERANDEVNLLIEGRPALHNLLEGSGYPAGFSIEVLNIKSKYSQYKNNIFIDELTILRVENLREFEWIDLAPAWQFDFGWNRLKSNKWYGDNNLNFSGEGKLGIASSAQKIIQYYMRAALSYDSDPNILGNFTVGLGVNGGIIFRFHDLISARFDYNFMKELKEDISTYNNFDSKIIWSISTKNALELQLYQSKWLQNYGVFYNYYF